MKQKLLFIIVAMFFTLQLSAQTSLEMERKTEVPIISAFPIGNENTGFQQYFTGKSWIAPLATQKDLNVPIFNVTFEPGCRNNWHSHTGGQILIAVGGTGYYQEQGQPARRLNPGDVVEIAPNVVHWHGAAPDAWFSHLAIECNPGTNKNTWLDRVTDEQYRQATTIATPVVQISEKAKAYYDAMFAGEESDLLTTDPEFVERFQNFAYDEVVNHDDLDTRTRFMAILATLIGCQGTEAYEEMLVAALHMGVTPIEAKEIVYQAVDYCGIGRVRPFLTLTNKVFIEQGIKLPLEGQATTTVENRLEKGSQAQVDIFGPQMKDFYKSGDEDTRHINLWLAENCFGDYYTRGGLNYQQREMLTFCYLAAQGGCESQLLSHAKANIKVGNDKDFLIKIASQCLPYIGYPRTLNALNCIKQAAQ